MNEQPVIADLNHLPAWLLEEARSLTDEGAVQSLLMTHTSPECWDYLVPFIEDVVLGHQPAASWLLGQVVVPDFSLRDQLTLTRSALLAPIGGEFTRRVVPVLDDWQSHASWIGAPALVLPRADYRYRVPAQAIGMGNVATEEVTNRTVVLRRWIAVRLALVAKDTGSAQSIEQLAATLDNLPAIAEWSEDARRAASALIREYQELGEHDHAIPGMRGPDDWF
jgi:hypothetical protein